METSLPTRRRLLLPMLFALIALMLATYLWTSFGGSIPFSAAGYRVTALLPEASNLYGGDDVRIAGINVGRVVGVHRAGSDAAVTMQIDSAYAPLHSGASVILRTKTLLGEAYLDIAPGPPSDPTIRDGGRISPGHVVPARQLSYVLATFDPRTRRNLQQLLSGLAVAAHGRAVDLNEAAGWSAPAMTNLGNVLAALDGQRSELSGLIGASGVLLGRLGSRQGTLQAAVTAGDRVLRATASASVGVRDTVDVLPSFLEQLRSTTGVAAAASADVESAVRALDPASVLLVPALDQGASLARQLRPLFTALPGLVAAARRGLPAGTALLRAARPAFDSLQPAMSQLVPVVQLLAVVRNSVVAAFANVASVGEGSQPRPGFSPHYLAATQLYWNEMIGGYQKRLPTNRQNPYPAPNSQLLIAHGGLHAYDCRNIHNALIVPPIDGAAPPCVTQGPWAFDGVSRYFPQLQAAKP